MSWFNYPPDPEPIPLAYFRERKLKAKEIDAGMTIGEKSDEEIQKIASDARSRHPSSGNRLSGHSAICELRTLGDDTDDEGSPDDPFVSWIRLRSRR